MKKDNVNKTESFCVNVINEVLNEDGSATLTIEYDKRFVALLKKHYKLDSLLKRDMEKYFVMFLTEAIENFNNKLTESHLDSISTKM